MPARSSTHASHALIRPGLARALCWGLLLACFLAYAISLDRYPQSYIDEPYFNGPAARYLEGKGLTYPVGASAPNADRLWCYHAPFFPRMQIATLQVLGKNELACRLPQFVSAYLAVGLLCGFLIRRGLPIAALVLTVAWIGDRSTQEVLYGRMDGIALLCVTLGYLALVGTLERPRWWCALACGASLGMAVGFHPVTVPFGVAAAVLIAAFGSGTSGGGAKERCRAIMPFIAGGMLPLALILWAWSPDFRGAIAQFRWALSVAGAPPLLEKLGHVLEVLRWSRYWPLGLIGAVVLVLAPGVLARLAGERRTLMAERDGCAWLAACVFAVAGCLCLLSSAVFPYYLIYFTLWPVLALVLTPAAGPRARGFRAWFLAVAAAVVLCWVPSLLWNGLRLRESLIYRRQLSHAHFVEQLRRAIPKGTNVTGEPIFFMMMQEAGLDYTPVPWVPEQSSAASNAWVLLSSQERQRPKWISAASLEGRAVIAEGDAYPGAGPFHLEYVILGPKAAQENGASR